MIVRLKAYRLLKIINGLGVSSGKMFDMPHCPSDKRVVGLHLKGLLENVARRIEFALISQQSTQAETKSHAIWFERYGAAEHYLTLIQLSGFTQANPEV